MNMEIAFIQELAAADGEFVSADVAGVRVGFVMNVTERATFIQINFFLRFHDVGQIFLVVQKIFVACMVVRRMLLFVTAAFAVFMMMLVRMIMTAAAMTALVGIIVLMFVRVRMVMTTAAMMLFMRMVVMMFVMIVAAIAMIFVIRMMMSAAAMFFFVLHDGLLSRIKMKMFFRFAGILSSFLSNS